jgi:hypothetical protein
MINNNNNFSDIDSMSASVYYGDGSNLTGSTGNQSLASVLLFGATASTSIDMNGNNISEINTIGYTDGTTIDLINTINMSLLALMYNT